MFCVFNHRYIYENKNTISQTLAAASPALGANAGRTDWLLNSAARLDLSRLMLISPSSSRIGGPLGGTDERGEDTVPVPAALWSRLHVAQPGRCALVSVLGHTGTHSPRWMRLEIQASGGHPHHSDLSELRCSVAILELFLKDLFE